MLHLLVVHKKYTYSVYRSWIRSLEGFWLVVRDVVLPTQNVERVYKGFLISVLHQPSDNFSVEVIPILQAKAIIDID